jgi:glycerophosphoryl diester phosphodiesterase
VPGHTFETADLAGQLDSQSGVPHNPTAATHQTTSRLENRAMPPTPPHAGQPAGQLPASASPAGHTWGKAFVRIGHGGAAGHARANSLRSLSLALRMGADMVEFDVRPCRDALVLLHDDSLAEFGVQTPLRASTLDELQCLDCGTDGPIATFAEALDLLKGRALINVDLKDAGYEQEAVEMVRARGLGGDVIYSSLIPASLQRIRQLDAGAITGLSYPEDRGNASGKPYLKPVVHVALALMRLLLPYRILGMMTNARANATMLYYKAVSRATVQTVQRAKGKVYTWTVDDPADMQRLRSLGVDGITSNFPDRLNG